MARIALVSRPCTVFTSAHFCRPSDVLGPVEAPPCVLHTALPLIAALRHWFPLRLERALQRQAEDGEPNKYMTKISRFFGNGIAAEVCVLTRK